MKSVIIIGASGYGKVVADIVQKAGDRVAGFLDDSPERTGTFSGFPMLGTVEKHRTYKEDAAFVIAIGNADVRERIAIKLEGVTWYTAIHPAAVVSDIDVNIGEGSVVIANAVINSGSKIGRHCIINSGAIVEHDNIIKDFVHISVGARLAGTVIIGKATWIGIGASVSNNITICEKCIIGAGGVVVKNIEKSGTYVGVPIERLDMKDGKIVGGGKRWIAFTCTFANNKSWNYSKEQHVVAINRNVRCAA